MMGAKVMVIFVVNNGFRHTVGVLHQGEGGGDEQTLQTGQDHHRKRK